MWKATCEEASENRTRWPMSPQIGRISSIVWPPSKENNIGTFFIDVKCQETEKCFYSEFTIEDWVELAFPTDRPRERCQAINAKVAHRRLVPWVAYIEHCSSTLVGSRRLTQRRGNGPSRRVKVQLSSLSVMFWAVWKCIWRQHKNFDYWSNFWTHGALNAVRAGGGPPVGSLATDENSYCRPSSLQKSPLYPMSSRMPH